LLKAALLIFIFLHTNLLLAQKQEITVGAASSLREVIEDIGKNFEKENPSIKVKYSFAGTQSIFRQIENKAPIDIFISAHTKYILELEKRGDLFKNTYRIFAKNLLVVAGPSHAQIEDLSKLNSNKFRKIAIGSEAVPAGIYARELLSKNNLIEALNEKFVKTTSVRHALKLLNMGLVDAAFVYKSDLYNAKPNIKEIFTPKPEIIAEYPVAVLNYSQEKLAALVFYEYLLSKKSQTELRKYSFLRGGDD